MDQVTVEKEKKEDVVIIQDAPTETPEPKQTVKDAEEAGLTPEEIEAGKKAGMIADKAAPEKKEDEPEKAEKADPKPESKPKFEPKPWEKDLGEDEKAALDGFSPNEKALYWKQKKEKHRRQEAEIQRDKVRVEAAFWKGKAEESAKHAAAAIKVAPVVTEEPELDELGEPKPKVDDKNKPLTKADLERIEQEKADAAAKAQKEQADKVAANSKILDEQEMTFKEDHPDFDDVWIHTQDILDNARNEEKLKEWFPDPVQRRGVKAMVNEFAFKLTHPDQVKNGDSIAAELAYEIGKLHPKAQESEEGDKDLGNEDPDEESKNDALKKRLEKQGRPSSAPLSGAGGRRPVSVNDLTVEDVHKMNDRDFAALRKKHPQVIDRLLAE